MAVRGSRGARKSPVNTDKRNASAPATASRDGEIEDERTRNAQTPDGETAATKLSQATDPPEAPREPASDSPAASESGQMARPDPAHVAVAAYYLAERRGFDGDRQLEDWLAAERSLAAEYAGSGDDELSARGAVEEDIQPDEVEQWAQTFNVTPERLRVAIQRVGPASREVRKFLEQGGY